MKINRAYLMTAALLSATCLFCGCGTDKIEEEYNTSLKNYEVPLTSAINWIKI